MDRNSLCRYQIHHVPTLPSTNTYLMEAGKRGEGEGLAVIADEQSGGRGRLGRSFFSPSQSGLYLSVLLRPTCAPQEVLLITTAAAVAVAEALEELTGQVIGIKWVNDLFLDDKKVGGILTEGAFTPDGKGLSYAVLGIGVNLSPPSGGFPSDLLPIAGAIGRTSSPTMRDKLARAVLDRFFCYYDRLAERRYYDAYRRRLLFLREEVRVIRGTESFTATALDVDRDFRLIVQRENGEREALTAGEISIRPNA